MEALVLDLKKQYTYADYLSWKDDVRRELIDGFIKLFPAPVDIHAEVSYRITRQLGNYIESRLYWSARHDCRNPFAIQQKERYIRKVLSLSEIRSARILDR